MTLKLYNIYIGSVGVLTYFKPVFIIKGTLLALQNSVFIHVIVSYDII